MLQKYISSNQKILKWKNHLRLENISGDFLDNSMKKTGLNGCVYDFSVDFKAFDISDFNNIHKYLIKSRVIK